MSRPRAAPLSGLAGPPRVVTFFVAGVPTPWRAPMVVRGGRHSFTPSHVRAWHRLVKAAAVEAQLREGE